MSETDQVKERYAKRQNDDKTYSYLNADVYLRDVENQKVILNILATHLKESSYQHITVTDVGCGKGRNLSNFIRYGVNPKNLTGIELLVERADSAKLNLPSTVNIQCQNALDVSIQECSQDIVMQSVVFSSILDLEFQEALASKMWSWVKPGGGILWYDFAYNNPNNKDVRKVPLSRIKELFPNTKISSKKVNLAPPLARRISNYPDFLYNTLNSIPFLRTHLICWIEKPI